MNALEGALERGLGAAPADPLDDRVRITARIRLRDGRQVFLKADPAADPEHFPAEARALVFLAGARALPVVDVLAVSDAAAPGPRFLVVEALSPRPPAPGDAEALGAGLAALHAAPCPGPGFPRDGFIAALPQDNRPAPSWSAFWRDRRLAPLLERAARAGLPPDVRRGVEAVMARIAELAPEPARFARLHGDLWSGNVVHDAVRGPTLVDPAAYGGHHEVDLAMMRLFGGFDPRVHEAYAERFPLAPGHAGRVPLWQLQPLLVHAVLFGAAYHAPLARAVDALIGRRR